MKKSEFVAKVAQRASLTNKNAEEAINAVLETVKDVLRSGQEMNFTNFGKFYVSKTAARTGRNPQTGQPLKIPASVQAKFKAGKGLKDAVNP